MFSRLSGARHDLPSNTLGLFFYVEGVSDDVMKDVPGAMAVGDSERSAESPVEDAEASLAEEVAADVSALRAPPPNSFSVPVVGEEVIAAHHKRAGKLPDRLGASSCSGSSSSSAVKFGVGGGPNKAAAAALGKKWKFRLADYAQVKKALPYVDHLPEWVVAAVRSSCGGEVAARGWPRAEAEKMAQSLPKAVMPYQREGVQFALEKGGRVLFGDEMGLGKSLQALMTIRCYSAELPALIVCPSSLRFGWRDQVRNCGSSRGTSSDQNTAPRGFQTQRRAPREVVPRGFQSRAARGV